MYQVTIHFDGGQPPVELLAEDFNLESEKNLENGGLSKFTYMTRGGCQTPIYLNMSKVTAIVSAPASVPEPQSYSQAWIPDDSSNSEESVRTHDLRKSPELQRLEQHYERRSLPRRGGRRASRNLSGASPDLPRSPELEHEVLRFLARFGAAEARQLTYHFPIRSRLLEQLQFPSVAERFFDSQDLASDLLDSIKRKGLIDVDRFYFQSDADPAYQITDKGQAAVNMGDLPTMSVYHLSHGLTYYTQMVDLYHSIMSQLAGNVAWITGRELLTEKLRIAWEVELGRRLPSAIPGAHRAWPMTPEGVLAFECSNAVAAVGLELTRVSPSRLAAYKDILDNYYSDPDIDRAHLFFSHEEAMQRVEELARRYPTNDFFTFSKYPIESASEIFGRE